eukprot:gene27147-33407_t
MGQAFLAAFVEDFADEWLTKVMFECRFHTAEDSHFGAAWQGWQGYPELHKTTGISEDMLELSLDAFAERQRKRRGRVVGSPWEVVVFTLRRVCAILKESIRAGHPFLFGSRPTIADFGVYGQLSQLAKDRTVCSVVQEYPEAWGWVWKMDDLSGYEAPVDDPSVPQESPKAVLELLRLASKTYIPFLLENARAVHEGKSVVEVEILDGRFTHSQPSFKYQATYCLPQLRKQYAALTGDDLKYVNTTLLQAGCYNAFASGSACVPSSKL